MSPAFTKTRPRRRWCCESTRNPRFRLIRDRSLPVMPMMPSMPERRTHDYVRNGITSLIAAFNIADGSVISALHHRTDTMSS